jgi:hypothetical protein
LLLAQAENNGVPTTSQIPTTEPIPQLPPGGLREKWMALIAFVVVTAAGAALLYAR